MKFVYKNKEYELEYVIDPETGELLSEDEYLLVENVYGDIRTFLPISLTQRDRIIKQNKGFLIASCRKPICFIYKGKSDEDTIKKAKKQLLSMCQK